MRVPVERAFISVVDPVSIIADVKPIAAAKSVDTKRCLLPPPLIQGAPPSFALISAPFRTGTTVPKGKVRSAAVAVTASFERYNDARAKAEMGCRVLVWITQNDLPSALFNNVPSGCWVKLVISVPAVRPAR